MSNAEIPLIVCVLLLICVVIMQSSQIKYLKGINRHYFATLESITVWLTAINAPNGNRYVKEHDPMTGEDRIRVIQPK